MVPGPVGTEGGVPAELSTGLPGANIIHSVGLAPGPGVLAHQGTDTVLGGRDCVTVLHLVESICHGDTSVRELSSLAVMPRPVATGSSPLCTLEAAGGPGHHSLTDLCPGPGPRVVAGLRALECRDGGGAGRAGLHTVQILCSS